MTCMDRERLTTLIESSDLNGLVRFVDGLVASRDWDGVALMRDLCREAVDRGKQVWGAAEFAEYRLALDAPASYVLDVVRPGAGRYGNGPLWEVAASTHSWEELSAIQDPALRVLVAHERMLRGDTLEGVSVDQTVVDAPLKLALWEPDYPVAEYRSDRANFPELAVGGLRWVDLPEPIEPLKTSTVGDALLDLVRPWIDESSGRGDAVAVEGSAEAAIRALGPHRVRLVDIDLKTATGVMCWAGASGGAYGRRRGSPVGRALAWWTLAIVLGMDEQWPVDGDELGVEAAGLRWVLWDPGDQTAGWAFHLAIEDPVDGLAWAVSAVDAR